MMTKINRRIIFYSLVVVFLILGVGITFYAQGYRLDLQTLTANKIGGIYVRTFPGDAAITLDGYPIKRPFSFFETGVLMNDLFPKTHLLTIAHDGYQAWKKQVVVQPSMVTDFKYAVLVPTERTTANEMPAFAFWIVGTEPLVRTPTGTLVWKNMTIPGDVSRGATADLNRLLTETTVSHTYFWTNLETGKATAMNPLLRIAGVAMTEAELAPDPENSSRLIVAAPELLALYDVGTAKLSTLATSTFRGTSVDNVAPSRTRIAWSNFRSASNTTEVMIYNKNTGRVEASGAFAAGRTKKLAWNGRDVLTLLQESGALYLYDADTNAIEGRANDVRDFFWSDDGSMLVALEAHSVEVFSFAAQKDYWRLNLPNVEDIHTIEWYKDNYHLFLHFPDRTSFVGLEDHSLENIKTAAETTRSIYEREENRLYYIANAQLNYLTFPK